MSSINILSVPISAINMHQAVARIDRLIQRRQKAYVTVTGVHGIIESQYDEELKRIHQNAAMCVPDGMPTVWIGKLYGHRKMSQVYGLDLMLEIMRIFVEKRYSPFLYGGKKDFQAN